MSALVRAQPGATASVTRTLVRAESPGFLTRIVKVTVPPQATAWVCVGCGLAVPYHLLVGFVGGRLDDRDVRGDYDRVLAFGTTEAHGAVVVVVVAVVAGSPVVRAGLGDGDRRRGGVVLAIGAVDRCGGAA